MFVLVLPGLWENGRHAQLTVDKVQDTILFGLDADPDLDPGSVLKIMDPGFVLHKINSDLDPGFVLYIMDSDLDLGSVLYKMNPNLGSLL